jgi:transposase
MRDTDLLQLALQLPNTWHVESSEFNADKSKLTISLNYKNGETFDCPTCHTKKCNVHDSSERSWRHLNFFQHETHLNARLPRINCDTCGVKTIDVPWARKKSGFTLLFESYLLTLAKEMPVNAIQKIVNEQDTRIWRVLKHYVIEAREALDFSNITQVGVDETSSKKGHKYITVFVDMETSNVIYSTEGKGADTIGKFVDDLKKHGGAPENITDVSMDMSAAFISGVNTHLEDADITFDKFHIVKIINNAVSKVRSAEAKEQEFLKGTRYVWLKNRKNLTKKQEEKLNEILGLKNMNLKTIRAYNIKLAFQELFEQPSDTAEEYLKKWYYWATHSRIEPIIDAARTVKNHWDGILKWFESGLTNGVVEGLNGQIQNIKSRARGFRNNDNFITMIYLKLGGILSTILHTK